MFVLLSAAATGFSLSLTPPHPCLAAHRCPPASLSPIMRPKFDQDYDAQRPSVGEPLSSEVRQQGLYLMAERVFGETQGDWVYDKMTMFGGTDLDFSGSPPTIDEWRA
ncbi:MAG: hypothetical protein SGPRY_008474 [Prymnesium sp.]